MERESITLRPGESLSIDGPAKVIIGLPKGRGKGRRVPLKVEHDGSTKIVRVKPHVDNPENSGS